MEDFLIRPREESAVIEPTRPKLNRFTYAADIATVSTVS
jgi:hypothetical protein